MELSIPHIMIQYDDDLLIGSASCIINKIIMHRGVGGTLIAIIFVIL
jgi:hypothetical protein